MSYTITSGLNPTSPGYSAVRAVKVTMQVRTFDVVLILLHLDIAL